MVSQQIIEIIIRAEDKASQQADKVKDKLKGMGDTAKKANEKAAKSSQQFQQKTGLTGREITHLNENLRKVGEKGKTSFDKLSKSEQDSLIKFNMLDKGTRNLLGHVNKVGNANFSGLSGAVSDAKRKFQSLEGVTKTWSGSLDYAKSKMQLLGNNTNTLKGKIQTTGMAIQAYLGTKWDVIKTKVSGVAQSIKGKIGTAIDALKSKLGGLVGGFNKLGASAKSAGMSFGFLRNAGSMLVGMIGYDLFNSFIQYGRAAINAQGQLDYFGSRLDWATGEQEKFNASLDRMQKQFRKVDMKMVGASAEEMAVKYGLATSSLEDLTRVTTVMSSAFVKEGRSQEDAVLAVSDALDGQFRRLQELGITQDMLIANGWSGDLNDKESLLKSMNKTLDDMGFTETAQDITNLDEAFQALGVAGGQLLASVLIPLTPIIVQIAEAAMTAFDIIKGFIGELYSMFGGSQEGSKELKELADSATVFGDKLHPMTAALTDVGEKVDGAITIFQKLKNIWDGLPEWQKLAILITSVAIAAGILLVPALTSLLGLLTPVAVLIGSISFPIVAIVAIIGVLVAAIYEIGKSFGWWTDVRSMLDAIRDGIRRLWEAFINNPHVQQFIKELSAAWEELKVKLGPVIEYAEKVWNELFPPGTNYDIVRDIIDKFGSLSDTLARIVGAAKNAWNALSGFISFIMVISAPIESVRHAFMSIVCILLGCSPGIVPALEKVQEVFMAVWGAISGFIGGIISGIVSAIQPILDILMSIGSYIVGYFQYSWQTLVMVFSIVLVHVNQIINIFSLFMSGQISLSSALSMVWETIKSMFITVLSTIISRAINFATVVVNKAIETGRGFFNGIVNYIVGLPSKVYLHLLAIVSYIIAAGASWISNATSAASSMVSGVISYVCQLPEKVYNEFINIGSRIMAAGGQLVEKAKNIGKNIVDGLLGAMGIHSPGIIQTKVVTEFHDMVGGVADYIKPAMETAKELGEGVVDAFGEPSLSIDTTDFLNEDAMKTAIGVQAELINDLDAPSMDLGVGVDTSGLGDVAESNDAVIGSYDNLANMTGNSLQKMVNQDKLAYTNIRNNDANQLSSIKNNLSNNMNNMTSKVNSSLNTMINKNKTGLNSARATTQTQLTNITNQTTKANQQMVKSWNTMKNGIVSAADKIKKDSTTHFNKLSGTIGSFYGKLKNPSRWGAGPGNGKVSNVKRIGSSNGGVKRITKAINAMNTPRYLTLGQVKQNPLIDSSNFGDYITRGPNNKFDLSQILKYGALTIPIGLGAGDWESTAPAHVRKIKTTSGNWDIKSPNIGRYHTNSAAFKVKEFESGTPRINYNTFRRLAEEVFSQTHYEFYYDNDHHGNWLNAFNAGSMNCLHGAQAIIAMARAMGLSGNLVHGHWNQYGHFWANIAGHKMDVTGWQNRRTWTPSASHAGPGPKTPTFGDLVDEINKDNTEVIVENTSSSDEVIVNGEVTVKHEHKFINLPDTVSAEEVARLINDTPDDDTWIKKLVRNVRFQKWDLKEKAKIERRNNRAIGV